MSSRLGTAYSFEILGVVVDIVARVVLMGSEYEIYGAWVKITFRCPDHGRKMDPAPRPIQMDRAARISVIDVNVDAPGEADHELMTLFVCVSASAFIGRKVVDEEHSLDIEGNVAIPLEKGQIPPAICDLRQVEELTVGDPAHEPSRNAFSMRE
jgi:hypothetical protein